MWLNVYKRYFIFIYLQPLFKPFEVLFCIRSVVYRRRTLLSLDVFYNVSAWSSNPATSPISYKPPQPNMNHWCQSPTLEEEGSSPTFSVRPRSSGGRVTVDLIRRSWVRFPPGSFTSGGSLIPFTRANAQWVFHAFHIALKFTLQS